MRNLAPLLPLLLASCATLTDALAPPYAPIPLLITKGMEDVYAADVAFCQAAGKAWKPTFSLGTALNKTVTGATTNTSMIPVSPLVPVYGAAGGALTAASDGLDVMSVQHTNVARNCLMDKTRMDGSAIIANPN